MKGKGGFTLMELLVVLIILGILAAIGIPTYTGVIEKARAKQAIEMLGTIKGAQAIWHLEKGSYADNANFSSGNLGINATPTAGKIYWNFRIPTSSTTAFTANANRLALGGGNISLYIAIDQDGNWSGNHPGTPLNPQ